MRRATVLLLTTTLILAAGCGINSYEKRMEATLENLKYRQKLDTNLMPAPEDDAFKNFPLYVRPAKDMQLASKFTLAQLPPGQFDLASSFLSQNQPPRSLHILARKPVVKKAPAKGAPPEAAPQRSKNVEEDVLNVLRSVYGAAPELQAPKYKTETERGNEYKHLTFKAPDGANVHVYFFKRDPYDGALIWVMPEASASNASLLAARNLTLGSFGVGRRAQLNFAGGVGEEEGAAPKGEGGAVAF